MRDLVLVSYSNPDIAQVEDELQPLLAAFAARKVSARIGAWDDPTFDWAAAPLAVLRTPWNYHRHVHAFLQWAARVPRLLNPASVVRWNANKTYLKDLEAKGIAVVPTEWLTADVPLAEVLERRGWSQAVLKPSISAGSFRTRRFAASEAATAQPLLTEILADATAMVQPYLPSVETSRERSYLYFGGALSHVVSRHPPLSTGLHGGVSAEPQADERALAEAALAAAPGPLLYARVDLARDANGRPCLMELELIEPTFFLDTAKGAADRFVEAVLSGAQGQMPAP